ncbi:ELKS/Rab6-interacting/CAST family member 1-like isoform X2 [Bolinopsis microptera]|uniref:ELKS/Rab6-interacting/CAST family member 1-like isoform X2 n=1 Tax=Bolinopsis microptera TaxID=2820187 RepID=UPI003079F72F
MKPVLLGILSLLQFVSTSGDSTADQRRFNALKFGNSVPDYIIYKPSMGPLQNAFSVCSWVRGIRSSSNPSWLSYAVNSGSSDEILISSNGNYNIIFDSGWSLKREISSVPLGTWYHYCGTWSISSRTHRVYLNGQLIGSRSTPSGRKLGTNGYLVIGNDQDSYGGTLTQDAIFGGELYKLNLFSKELSSAEVQEMAKDKCTEIEETYGVVRSIKWEQILLKTRNGEVTEIESGCVESIRAKEEKEACKSHLEDTERQMNATLAVLENKEQQMNATLAELEETKSDLEDKERQMNATLAELEETKSDLEDKEQQMNATLAELEETKSDLEDKEQQMNATLAELEETKSDLKSKEQQLNRTEAQKQTTLQELDTTTQDLNSTSAALNQTLTELQQVKELLENTTCHANTTVTSHWDLLYSEEYFGGIFTAEKLEILRKSVAKLGHQNNRRAHQVFQDVP